LDGHSLAWIATNRKVLGLGVVGFTEPSGMRMATRFAEPRTSVMMFFTPQSALKRFITCRCDNLPWIDIIVATTPATCGEAIDVPEKVATLG